MFDATFGAGKVTCFFDEEQSDIGDASDRQFYLLRIAEIFALGASVSKYPVLVPKFATTKASTINIAWPARACSNIPIAAAS